MPRRSLARLTALSAVIAASTATASCTREPHDSPSPGRGDNVEDNVKNVGFVLSHETFTTPELVDQAQAAEEAGFQYLWASDHLQPWQDNQGHSMFPWFTLALVTQRTNRVEIGTGVTCPTYRYHPAIVAQAFASLALLAPQRVFLGVGTGERLNEQSATGRYGPYSERRDRLVEAIGLIRQLWTGERVSAGGPFYPTETLRLYDVPPTPPPIFVAASGPKSAEMAGRHGDGWISQPDAVHDPELAAAFEKGAREAGRDPSRMGKRVEVFAVVGDRDEVTHGAQLWRFGAAGGFGLDKPNPVDIQRTAEETPVADPAAGWLVGTDPGVHVEAIQRIRDGGATPFVHFAQRNPLDAIDFYRKQVLPKLR